MRICELLEDGRWHPVTEIVAEAGWVIPPGKAIRMNEKERGHQTSSERYVQRPSTRLVQSGRRSIVRQALSAKWFEKDRAGSPHDTLQHVRMMQMPPSVVRERLRQVVEALKKGDMEALVDGDPETILTSAAHYSHGDVLQIAIELANREKERALAARLLLP